MAYNYIDTPRTDAGDRTHLTAANISFSEVQGYPSPSKDPANNLVGQMRSRNGAHALKTPRARSALAGLRAGGKNEFTPLLKSAAHNRFRTTAHSPHKYSRDGKENGTDDLVNSMLATSTNQAPQTPAYLKAGYRESGRTPRLPVDSSMLDGDVSRSSLSGGKTPGPPPPISSSTLMSTPIPELPARGEQGRGEKGNVLTLREQEAKLAKLDKENFNLKLKIHFLDEALKRTGTDYQQGMIKENTELKMDKTTMAYELKQQQKSLLRAEKELEEYRLQLREYAEKVKRRHTDEIMKEEMERLRKLAEDNQRLADEREQEIDELHKRLDLAESGSDDKLQDLKDDIADLEQDLRAKDQEIDTRDEEIESLQTKLKSTSGRDEEVQALQQELEEVEAELEEKDSMITSRDQEISEMKSQLRNSQDREKSTKKLRGDVDMLEAEIREKDAVIDEKHEELRGLQKRLQLLESQGAADLQAKAADVRDKERLLEDKDGEIKALEQRLKTARGSWDAEVQQTDARLQEKDTFIQERDSQLREKARLVDEKDVEIRELRRRLESKEHEASDAVAQQEKQTVQRTAQIFELQEKVRKANTDLDFHIDKKNVEIQKLRAELESSERDARTLKERLESRGSPAKRDAMISDQAIQIRQLQAQLKTAVDDKEAELEVLERQLTAVETELEAHKASMKGLSPSRSSQMSKVQEALSQALEEKELLDEEVLLLETNLEEAENEKAALQKILTGVQQELLAAKQDQTNDNTPVRERNELRLRVRVVEKQMEDYKHQVELLERELAKSWDNKAAPIGSPNRERSELRTKLSASEAMVTLLEGRIAELESNTRHQRDTTSVGERRDLHNMLRDAQIEIENLQTKSQEQEKRMAHLTKKESDTRAQLYQLRGERDEGATELAVREGKISKLTTREKELRAQLQDLRSAKSQLDDVEYQLGAKKDSSSYHARREAELRAELRDTKSEVDRLTRQVQTRDDKLQDAVKKEQHLRDRLKKSRQADTEQSFIDQELNARLEDADIEVQALQVQLRDREKKLAASSQRETELRSKLKSLRGDVRAAEDAATNNKALEVQEKTHEKELRGLSKQIQYLLAKCNREESFRRDLVFIKRWFLLQVEMYGACNKADLRMLEEMGITPDVTVREKRPSLRAAGLAVVATIRMRKMQQAWAGNKKLHESLLRKLESMKTKKAVAA